MLKILLRVANRIMCHRHPDYGLHRLPHWCLGRDLHWDVLDECLLRMLDNHAIAMLGHGSEDHVRSSILDDHVLLENLTTLRENCMIHLTRVYPECVGLLVDGVGPLMLLLDLNRHPVVL